MRLDIGQVVDVEGKGKMLVQSVSREKITLIGRGPNNNQIKTIRSIEVNRANMSNSDTGEVRLKEPYENLLISNRQNPMYCAMMEDYLSDKKL